MIILLECTSVRARRVHVGPMVEAGGANERSLLKPFNTGALAPLAPVFSSTLITFLISEKSKKKPLFSMSGSADSR